MSCLFCNDPRDAGAVLRENDHVWIVRHPDGQHMVVAKRHVQNVSDLDEETWLQVARSWHQAEAELRAQTGASRVVVMKLGLQTPHLHIHLYPFDEAATRQEVIDVIEGRRALRLTPAHR